MRRPFSIKYMIMVIFLVAVLQIALTWVSWRVAEASTEGGQDIGRYQVSSYGGVTSMALGNGKEVPRILRGYVVIDTTTGKVVEKNATMQLLD